MSDTPDYPFTSPDSKGSLVTSTTETVSPSNQSAIAHLRQQAIQRLRNNLRPGQQSMADWQGGSLAVSAVLALVSLQGWR